MQQQKDRANAPRNIVLVFLALILIWRLVATLSKLQWIGRADAPLGDPIYQVFAMRALIDQTALIVVFVLALVFRSAQAAIIAFVAVLVPDLLSIGQALVSGALADASPIHSASLAIHILIAVVGLFFALQWHTRNAGEANMTGRSS
ncbi:MAG: hypothetical protein ACRDAM_10555 [Casimicrobium sp.]